jgi:hypothetical protein
VKRFVCVVAITVAITTTTATATTGTPRALTTLSLTCKGAVGWNRAASFVGRVATVSGRVAGTKYASSSNGSPTFLNVGVDYPDPNRFTIVIWIENRSAFGRPETRYRGHTICVRGLISSYAGGAEIIARTPSQITITR